MAGPSWLANLLAAVMIATAAYCFSRLMVAWRSRRQTDYDVDGVHILMGVAMAGMLVPGLNPFWDSGWEVIFAGAVAWFAFQCIRGYRNKLAVGRRWIAHHLQHVVACGAMLYMFLAVAPAKAGGSGAGMAMGGSGSTTTFPTLALLLTLALVGYVIWNADRFTSLAPVAALRAVAVPAGAVVAPALAASVAYAAGADAPAEGTATQVAPPSADSGTTQSTQSRPPVSPRLAAVCEIVMGLTMGYMLITML
jgi:Domain of unknown function (DUF5134)